MATKGKILSILLLGQIIAVSAFSAQDLGRQVYNKLGCGGCHSEKLGFIAPSLQGIAKAYAGKEKDLEAFFLGQKEPLLDKSKFKLMKPYVQRTQKLSAEERKALVKYLLSF